VALTLRDTTCSGDLAKAKITIALVGAGKRVLEPLSAGCRYDLVTHQGDDHFARAKVLPRGMI
jgi:hypothetical protein